MLNDHQAASWSALLDLYEAHPHGWVLVGGQMVHLWCAMRGYNPTRPTDDADAVLDVRAEPDVLFAVTSTLKDAGFYAGGTTRSGHQHRWVRDGAVIDVLIPRFLGEHAANRPGVGGATTLETPGAQKVLDRSSIQAVTVRGRAGYVPRPTLMGALIAKASAYTVALDQHRDRHLIDFAVLSTLLLPADVRDDDPMDRLECQRIASMVGTRIAPGRIEGLSVATGGG